MENQNSLNSSAAKKEDRFHNFLRSVYRLRGILLSIPVAISSIVIAIFSIKILPKAVGILMQANGRYQFYISKPLAILIPLVLTGICVTLTICSKKVTFPWMISLFSLLLPLVLLLTSTLTS